MCNRTFAALGYTAPNSTTVAPQGWCNQQQRDDHFQVCVEDQAQSLRARRRGRRQTPGAPRGSHFNVANTLFLHSSVIFSLFLLELTFFVPDVGNAVALRIGPPTQVTVLRIWVPPSEAMPPESNITALAAALGSLAGGITVTSVDTIGRTLPTLQTINYTRFPVWNDSPGQVAESDCATNADCPAGHTCSPQWPPDPRDHFMRLTPPVGVLRCARNCSRPLHGSGNGGCNGTDTCVVYPVRPAPPCPDFSALCGVDSCVDTDNGGCSPLLFFYSS